MQLPKRKYRMSWVRQHRPLGLPKEFFIVLRAYMDDSGTHDGSDYCLIAGYWGSINEWQRFEKAWNAVLTEFGVAEFHAKTFWPRLNGQRVGEFRGWSDKRHATFIDRLLTVIQEHKVYPFAFGVLASDWQQAPIHLRRVYAGFKHTTTEKDKHLRAIYLAVQCAFVRIARYCRRDKVMHFFIDQDRKISGHVLECFTKLQSESKAEHDELWTHLGSLTFAQSNDSAPLQAADLLAYEIHRYYKKWRGGIGDVHMRKEGLRAMTRVKTRDDFWLFDKTRMANLTNTLEAAVR